MHEDAYPADLLHGMFAKLNALGVCDEPPADLYDHGMSDFYDGFMAEYVADIPVFEKLAPPGAKVLDLACGAGRYTRCGRSTHSRPRGSQSYAA